MNRKLSPLTSVAHFFGIDSRRAFAWVALGWAAVIGLFAAQYAEFGFTRFLGWDTSQYVQQAREIQVLGPLTMLQLYHYPNLYYYLVWAVGSLTGDLGVGERIFPVVMGMTLVALYHRMGRELFPDKGSAYPGVAAVLGGLSVNTMRILSDLHRNAFTLIACLAYIIVLAEVSDGRRSKRSGWIWLIVLSALASYTQIETFVLLFIVVIAYAAITPKIRLLSIASLLLPLVAAAPLLIGFFAAYPVRASVPNPADPVLTFADFAYYHGGLLPLVPVVIIGIGALAMRAAKGVTIPRLLILWYATAMELVLVLVAVHTVLPPVRPLLLIPIPVFMILGIHTVAVAVARLNAWVQVHVLKRLPRVPGIGKGTQAAVAGVVVVLVITATAVGLASQKDAYMGPFIPIQRYATLEQVGRALEPYSTDWPVIVFRGVNSTWYNAMDRSYIGALSGPVLGYYGRPQFLLSLTNPLFDEPGLTNTPDPTRFVATTLFDEATRFIGNESAVLSHPIVVSASQLYNHPVSDYFLQRFRVASGLYIVPPNSLTSGDMDTWVWFAAYDWQTASNFYPMAYPWAIAPHVLEFAVQNLTIPWSVHYPMILAQTERNTTLSIHLQDTPPFPGGYNVSRADEGTFSVFVDDVLVAHYIYGHHGPVWVNYTVGTLSAGPHIVTIQGSDLGKAFGISLDALALYPEAVTLPTLLAAYAV